ncbi:hypothetical protein BCR36DRAFT_366651 [Piromyces finnis]|uniref:Uncharacterized protein n=1 Tax=Piromyces finnis TaxID=1754191 RepID=A0A1Y1VLS1_9FUNG|nr:hypothetical protein BCR36DRAFT_366651 [Piromyces finnis]|eukprot:ORX58437.1 hypothetical protein BCR36DRAFT_366651 [Piromyces finnis]
MYCGKPYGEACINNEECSSMKCYENHCAMQSDGLSDSDSVKGLAAAVFLICIEAYNYNQELTINFQLFDLMLYENALYPYIYINENENIIKNQEKLVYTMNSSNPSLSMKLYNRRYKQFTETIEFQVLDWCKKIQDIKLYIDHSLVSHDKILLFDLVSKSNLVPTWVKVIRKYKEKKEFVYFNITCRLNEQWKGQFPSNLYISYGYELPSLHRQYFDTPEINNKFYNMF